MKTKLIFLAGPTGVGKTELSLSLAEAFDCQIICMDSMQIYKGMDIGTAKATKEEQSQIKHHLIDIVEPGTRFTVQDYQQLAYEKIKEITDKDKNVLFVGGTGLYMDAIIKDYSFAHTEGNKALRDRLEDMYQIDQGQRLLNDLTEIDPQTASELNPSDKKKIIRAIEVYKETGKTMSEHKKDEEEQEPWDSLIFILNRDREKLYERINQRVIAMLKQGLIEENMRLAKKGLEKNDQAMLAIGYREVQFYLRGLLTYEEMVRILQQSSRNYAKRQLTWFRKTDNAIWLDVTEGYDEAKREINSRVQAFLEGDFHE